MRVSSRRAEQQKQIANGHGREGCPFVKGNLVSLAEMPQPNILCSGIQYEDKQIFLLCCYSLIYFFSPHSLNEAGNTVSGYRVMKHPWGGAQRCHLAPSQSRDHLMLFSLPPGAGLVALPSGRLGVTMACIKEMLFQEQPGAAAEPWDIEIPGLCTPQVGNSPNATTCP